MNRRKLRFIGVVIVCFSLCYCFIGCKTVQQIEGGIDYVLIEAEKLLDAYEGVRERYIAIRQLLVDNKDFIPEDAWEKVLEVDKKIIELDMKIQSGSNTVTTLASFVKEIIGLMKVITEISQDAGLGLDIGASSVLIPLEEVDIILTGEVQ